MASEVTLSAAVRSSLLSLKNTSTLIARTEGRLSTGLRVASAVDDAVSFFQAKSLSDRAFDFNQKKDGIDQGVSTINAGLNAVEGIENLTQQLKGLSQALKSATGEQFSDLVDQFNDIRSQISTLAADSTYQGVNLVNGTGQILEVEFSEKSNSLLTVQSVDLTDSGLGVYEVEHAVTGDSIIEAEASTGVLEIHNQRRTRQTTAISALTVFYNFTYQGNDDVIGTGLYEVRYGTQTLTLRVDTGTVNLTQGRVLNIAITTNEALTAGIPPPGGGPPGRRLRAAAVGRIAPGAGLIATAPEIAYFDNLAVVRTDLSTDTALLIQTHLQIETDGAAISIDYVIEGGAASINEVIDRLDDALSTLRANAATLGSNVALLQTRLNFTNDYVNTLEGGAGKLTLSDINEEGANLLALQTRQQLGISALSFAGQAEQSILALFN